TPGNVPSRLDDLADALIHDLKNGLHVEAHTEALKAYGALLAPRLLHYLKNEPEARPVILFALQHCWSLNAKAPVAELLKTSDESVRKLAVMLIAKNEGLKALGEVCSALVDHADPDIAGFALERVEAEFPDLTRIRRALQRRELWKYCWKYLPRYYSPELTPATRRILNEGEPNAPFGALVALIHQNDRSEELRTQMTELLANPHADVRELAAEFLMWHGSDKDLNALDRALLSEHDVYARGSLAAAFAAIERRSALPPVGTLQPPDTSLDYAQASELLRRGLSEKSMTQAFSIYALREPFEPHCAFRGSSPSSQFIAERQARLKLQAQLFAIPFDVFGQATEHRGDFNAPPVERLVPPVREFFDEKRTSYAKDMDDSKDGFGGLFHVGDDMMWTRDHRSVVAVGNGLVRQVSCTPTWGHIVIVEHTFTSGEKFCSLYAHLSPFVSVRPGDTIHTGQKLGSIGRSFTWENGGYISHLHFGIHEGPFWNVPRPGSMSDVRWQGVAYRGKVLEADTRETWIEVHTLQGPYAVRKPTTWVCGYISKQAWEEGKHGWRDPQTFLREHA
ncbi:MAG TPA: peptidoglycan DD-metalloendopeptidase family protein, partial [Planctomycetota bacterium]|nr:peptidoglycan DD-metalloendopeptidase family protein [Planctomycetota bacterium]